MRRLVVGRGACAHPGRHRPLRRPAPCACSPTRSPCTWGVVAVATLRVDWTRCDGHGLCADLLPEVLDPRRVGLPAGAARRPLWLDVAPGLEEHARRAVDLCPLMALRLR